MDQGMAVRARPAEVLNRTERLRLRWVAAGSVAFVADPWHTYFQKLGITGAVRLMAVGAVLHDRRMLPHERPAPLGMAAVAVFVNRGLDKLARIRAAMGIVAAGASHLTFAIRHVRRTL